MTVSVIVAMAANRAIGKNNTLLWRLPSDLKRFKRLTMGHAIIMGRKTFASIGKPLSGRTNIVLTRDAQFKPEGVKVAGSLEAALKAAGGGEVFIIGGAEVYQAALPHADRLYLTLIAGHREGDVFFPTFDKNRFTEIDREDFTKPFPHSFQVLKRK